MKNDNAPTVSFEEILAEEGIAVPEETGHIQSTTLIKDQASLFNWR